MQGFYHSAGRALVIVGRCGLLLPPIPYHSLQRCVLTRLTSAIPHPWGGGWCHASVQDGGEAVSAVPGTYSARFRWALLALLPRTPEVARAALSSDGLPQVLLMAAHPAITAGVADKLSTWRAAVARLGETTGQLLKGECAR